MGFLPLLFILWKNPATLDTSVKNGIQLYQRKKKIKKKMKGCLFFLKNEMAFVLKGSFFFINLLGPDQVMMESLTIYCISCAQMQEKKQNNTYSKINSLYLGTLLLPSYIEF